MKLTENQKLGFMLMVGGFSAINDDLLSKMEQLGCRASKRLNEAGLDVDAAISELEAECDIGLVNIIGIKQKIDS